MTKLTIIMKLKMIQKRQAKKGVLELSLGRELKILFASEKTENRLKMQGKIMIKRFEGQKMPIFRFSS